jgi:hypothetical protein
MAFGSSGVPPGSTYRIAPANNRLQKNMYGGGYSEFMDYGAIDAFPNPGYVRRFWATFPAARRFWATFPGHDCEQGVCHKDSSGSCV